MQMLGRLLGLPDEDLDWLVDRGDALIGNTDADFTDFVVDQVDTSHTGCSPFAARSSLELFEFADGAMASGARTRPATCSPRSCSRPSTATSSTTSQLKNFFTLMVAAGNDTTRYTMASGLKALAERPDLLASLRTSRPGSRSVVEEMLRWSSTTMHFRRTATHDTELRGTTIRAGDKVVVWYVSADFDAAQFADPFHFDPVRAPNEHVAFGLHSPHLCLGAHLARLELRVLLEELLPMLESVAVVGTPERLRSNFISGFKRLEVEATWR